MFDNIITNRFIYHIIIIPGYFSLSLNYLTVYFHKSDILRLIPLSEFYSTPTYTRFIPHSSNNNKI